MYNKLKQEVFEANIKLVQEKLVILTWGNASGKSEDGTIAIKPSGVDYSKMQPNDMVLLDNNGNTIENNSLKPSSDTKTHIALYNAFPQIKSIIHTHSTYATAFAQAGISIKPLGTTHADYFYGKVPVTRKLTALETNEDYELNTGKVIIETIKKYNYNVLEIPAILVKQHGVFVWGDSIEKAIENAIVLEQIAYLNYLTLTLNDTPSTIPQYTLDKHFLRKHGKSAYYGQK